MGSKFKNRIERLEAQRDASLVGVVFHTLDDTYQLNGRTYPTWDDLPAGAYALVPERLSIGQWLDKTDTNAMRQQWEI